MIQNYDIPFVNFIFKIRIKEKVDEVTNYRLRKLTKMAIRSRYYYIDTTTQIILHHYKLLYLYSQLFQLIYYSNSLPSILLMKLMFNKNMCNQEGGSINIK